MPSSYSNITDEVQRSTLSSHEKNLNQDIISITELMSEEETIQTIDPKIEEKIRNVSKTREMALLNLKKQAEKMIGTSNSKYTAANVGDTVRIRVPDVDRARSDGKNILGVVVAVKDKNLYKLGTKYGILNVLYSRNQFTVCKENFISVEDVPGEEISLRECARMSSISGGQGCCKIGCKSNRCKCYKEKKIM
ncbi:uncharacterized protein [Centruroides vittatus]|uniref:uncharacterized protein n=1 Tax=Centruroides vittatus TaxID=120091 RepID=UPI003510B19A